MIEKPKLCKSCIKEAKFLSPGYCEKCLAVQVVKDWLQKNGVK